MHNIKSDIVGNEEIFLLKFKTSEALFPVSLLKQVGFNRERYMFFVVPEDVTRDLFEYQIELNEVGYIKLLYKNIYYMPLSIISLLIKNSNDALLKGLTLVKRGTHRNMGVYLDDFIDFVSVLCSLDQLTIKCFNTSASQKNALDIGHAEHTLAFSVKKDDAFAICIVIITLNTLKKFFDVQYDSMGVLDFDRYNVSYILKHKKYFDCDFLNLLLLIVNL